MTEIYQGAGVTEYHLSSGQILTLTEEDYNELLGLDIGNIDIEELQSCFDSYEECGHMLALAGIDECPYEFIEDVLNKLSLFKDDEGNIPSLENILEKLESDKNNLKEIISSKEDLINYLYNWIEDES